MARASARARSAEAKRCSRAAVHPGARNKRARSDGRHSLRETIPGQARQSGKNGRSADAADGSRALRFGRLPAHRKERTDRAAGSSGGKKLCAAHVPDGVRSRWFAKRQRGFHDGHALHFHGRGRLPLGNTYGIQTELFRPFRAESRWFFAPHADASDTAFPIYAKNDPLADYRIYRTNIGGDVGYSFGRFGELRVGYQVGSLNTKLRLGTPEIPSVQGRVGQTRLRYLLDHTDDPVIPRSGFSAETNFRWFDQSPGANGGFPSMDLKLGYFQPIARSASLFLESEGGTTFGSSSTGVPQFF